MLRWSSEQQYETRIWAYHQINSDTHILQKATPYLCTLLLLSQSLKDERSHDSDILPGGSYTELIHFQEGLQRTGDISFLLTVALWKFRYFLPENGILMRLTWLNLQMALTWKRKDMSRNCQHTVQNYHCRV